MITKIGVYMHKANPLSTLRAWADWFEPDLVDHLLRQVFSWRGSKTDTFLSAPLPTKVLNCAASWQNQQNGMCAQWRLRSDWADAQSDQSLHCPHEEGLGPYYPLSAQRRLRSDWADAQTDLSLRWAHRHFVFVMRRLNWSIIEN